MLSLGLAFGVSAQKVGRGGNYHRPPQRVVVVRGGFSPFYSPFYSPFGYGRPYYGYSPYGYDGYRSARPSKLDLQIADIKNDYSDKIKSARMDDQLSRKERRAVIQSLKHDREKQIIDAKRKYYRSDSRV